MRLTAHAIVFALLAACFPSASHAEIVRFRMTGTVTVDDPRFVLPSDVVTGASFTALLIYDTSVPDSLPDDPGRGRYVLDGSGTEFGLSLSVGSLFLRNDPTDDFVIQVGNDVSALPTISPPSDFLIFQVNSLGGPSELRSFTKPRLTVSWDNVNQNSWDSDALPTLLEPLGLRRADIAAESLGEPLPLGRPYYLTAFVTNVQVIPEPESIALVVAAIGTLVLARRKKLESHIVSSLHINDR